MLGSTYLTLHNLHHYIMLMNDLREAINNNNYQEVAKFKLNEYKKNDIEIYS
jgi:tRNA-guanine family transglycosylase